MRACTRHFGQARPGLRGRQAGQSMVEFALVAPLFLLLVLMIIEGGLMMNAQASLDDATREAARALSICGGSLGPASYGSITATSCVGVASAVVKANLGLQARTPNPPKVTQAPGYGGAASVTVQVDYGFYAPTFLGLGGPTVSLSSTAPVIGQQ